MIHAKYVSMKESKNLLNLNVDIIYVKIVFLNYIQIINIKLVQFVEIIIGFIHHYFNLIEYIII